VIPRLSTEQWDVHREWNVPPMKLWQACGLDTSRPVAVVGGGGKTTVVFELAREAREAGLDGTITTTTRMWMPSEPWLEVVLWGQAGQSPNGWRFYAATAEGHKALGLTGSQAAELAAARPGPFLIEADGSKGRPLKIHRVDEPVLPSCDHQALAVFGMSALGRAWSEDVVHRGSQRDALIGVEEMAELLSAMLIRLPQRAVVLLNQADEPRQLEACRKLSQRFPGVPMVARSHRRLYTIGGEDMRGLRERPVGEDGRDPLSRG
jgi:probable selenium-dependent hydroxylase accessory protein YqeC